MSSSSQPGPSAARRLGNGTVRFLTAIAMVAGRCTAARAVAETAGLTGDDRVVDVGCGTGTAVREAARHAAAATGIDPDTMSLALARFMTRVRPGRQSGSITWLQGSAEKLPLPDGSATVVWSLSAVHHWADRPAGFTEASRVLTTGGRLLIAERLTRSGARGHAAHGLNPAQAGQVAAELTAVGYADVQTQIIPARRRVLTIIEARKA
jgi:ubiquinone/menaquinone biosynthesis C-methylase UbiE